MVEEAPRAPGAASTSNSSSSSGAKQPSKPQSATGVPSIAATILGIGRSSGVDSAGRIATDGAPKPPAPSHLERHRRHLAQWWDEDVADSNSQSNWDDETSDWGEYQQVQPQESWLQQTRRWQREQRESEERRQRQWEEEQRRQQEEIRRQQEVKRQEQLRERELQLEREQDAAAQWKRRQEAAAAQTQRQQQDAQIAAQRAQQAAVEAQVKSGLEALQRKEAERMGASRIIRDVTIGSPGLAVAYTAQTQSPHTLLMPSQALGVPFTRGGALSHFEYDGKPWQLQQALMAATSDEVGVGVATTQEAFGSAQGWLDAARLLPQGSGSGGGNVGVQFEVSCERCWLLLDGAVIAGTRDGAKASPCVALPAAARAGTDKTATLVHVELQFTAKSLPVAAMLLRYRTCQLGGDAPDAASGGFVALGAALAPGWVLSPDELTKSGYKEGLMCEVALAAEPSAARRSAPAPASRSAVVFVPRRPGAPGVGGLHPASALRFAGGAGRHSSQAAFGDAALNVSASVSTQSRPEGSENGEQEEEEAREQSERRRQQAEAAVQRVEAQAPRPQLPPAADDSLGPLTAFLNNLLASWWSGSTSRKLLGASPGSDWETFTPLSQQHSHARRLQQSPAPSAPKQQRASRLLSLSPKLIAPAIVAAAAPGSLFDVSCWAYSNGTLAANATIGADPSGALGSAAIIAGGGRLATRAPSSAYVASVGVESVLTAWEEQRDRAKGAACVAPGGGVDWGLPERRGYAVSGERYDGGASGLLRLLVLQWRGVLGGSSLWVADARGPWELEPYSVWVPDASSGGAVSADGSSATKTSSSHVLQR